MRIFRAFLFVFMAVLACTVMTTASGARSVYPGHWEDWFIYDDVGEAVDNSLASFVIGPDTTPVGVGSVELSVSGTQRVNVATWQFAGTPLSAITEMSFNTYNGVEGNGTPSDTQRSAYINFNVDFNGSDTWQRRLVYLPLDNGTVVQDQWQEWNAIDSGAALWRYSGGTWPGGSTVATKSWSQILSEYPGVRIRISDPFFGIRVGEPYDSGYTENIDMVKFGTTFAGTTVFNFEPTTDACKKGLWSTWGLFTNQGLCVSYVNTGK